MHEPIENKIFVLIQIKKATEYCNDFVAKLITWRLQRDLSNFH